MKHFFVILATALCSPAFSAMPSDASVKDLLRAMESQKMLDAVSGQMDAVMQSSMQQALQGQEVTPDVRKAMDNMRAKMVVVMREELNWAKLEPLFIDLYKKSFTQSEIEGMLTFYKSEAGRAVIAKMPVVMQNSMQLMQQNMTSLMPKMQTIQQEFVEELKASCKDKCKQNK